MEETYILVYSQNQTWSFCLKRKKFAWISAKVAKMWLYIKTPAAVVCIKMDVTGKLASCDQRSCVIYKIWLYLIYGQVTIAHFCEQYFSFSINHVLHVVSSSTQWTYLFCVWTCVFLEYGCVCQKLVLPFWIMWLNFY